MERLIKVIGVGKLSLKPDLVVFHLTLQRENKDYSILVDESVRCLNQLNSLVNEILNKNNLVKSESFIINENYKEERDDKGNYKRVLSGFKSIQNLNLEVKNDNLLIGKLLSSFATSSLNIEINLSYQIKDQNKVKNQLIDLAIKDAFAISKQIAISSNLTLGEVSEIDYQNDDESYSPSVRVTYGRMNGNNMDYNSNPQNIVLTKTIRISFLIKQFIKSKF